MYVQKLLGTNVEFTFRRSYYLLIAITQDGYLKFEEDREDSTYGAEVKNRNFLNGRYLCKLFV